MSPGNGAPRTEPGTPVPHGGFLSVGNLMDAMRMRAIRNTCRRYMTYDTSRIGVFRQAVWYYRTYRRGRAARTLFGYLLWDGGRAVGYGLVSRARGRWWVTGGLVPGARGRGLGKRLFAFLTVAAIVRSGCGESWLNVFESNLRARKLYEGIGYEYVENEDEPGVGRILWMRCRRPLWARPVPHVRRGSEAADAGGMEA